MSDLSNQAAPSSGAPAPRRRSRGWLFITTVALAAAFTGALATRAVTQGGFGPGYWHGHGFMARPLTRPISRIAPTAASGTLAIEIDATNEQQEKLRAIVKGAVKDLLPMREKAQSARQRGRGAADPADRRPGGDRGASAPSSWRSPTPPASASRRPLAMPPEVLTPEQRRKIDDRLRMAGAQGLLAGLASRLVCAR